jgi:hypothetical protein
VTKTAMHKGACPDGRDDFSSSEFMRRLPFEIFGN